MKAKSPLRRILKRPARQRARLEAKARRATVYIARDGRGRVVGSR